MSYRKLTTLGQDFLFVVGKTHTKVRGFGVVENSMIGSYHWYAVSPCYKNCGCDPDFYQLELRVTPGDIAKYLKKAIMNGRPKEPMNLVPEEYQLGKQYKPSEVFAQEY